jgi:hypothetical protein
MKGYVQAVWLFRVIGNSQKRDAIRVCGCDSRKHVCGPWARCSKADADGACEAAEGISHVGTIFLVSGCDHLHPFFSAYGLNERKQLPSRNTKNKLDAAVNSYRGAGNPSSLGPLQAGERVLNIDRDLFSYNNNNDLSQKA